MTNALYQNPSLEINLPKSISKVNINSYNLLMGYGLKINKISQETKNGCIVIKVDLSGTQKDYALNSDYKGSILILNTNLTVNTLAPSGTDHINLTCTNQNSASVNKKVTAKASINIVAPSGIIAANGLSNFSKKENDIMTVSTEKTTEAKLQTYSEKQIATVSGKVVNNYKNNINNVTILGRIPAQNSTQPETGEVLGSTFDSKLNEGLKVSGINKQNYSVYYSNKPDATNDLNNKENDWTSTATSDSKSYLIKVENNVPIKQGEQIDFEYKIEIPENLSYNNSAYEMYQVYYNNVSSVGNLPESKTSPIVKTLTGEGPNLTASISSSADVVRGGQIVKMKVSVTNSGNTTANNVSISIPQPSGAQILDSYYASYLEDKVFEVGTLKPGNNASISYYVKIKTQVISYDENNAAQAKDVEKVEHTAKISADELENPITVSYIMNNIKQGNMELRLENYYKDDSILEVGQSVSFAIYIKNISIEKVTSQDTAELKLQPLTNVKVNIPLPETLKYVESNIVNEDGENLDTDVGEITYNENEHSILVTIKNINQDVYAIKVDTTLVDVGDISIMATATADNVDTHYSNLIEMTAEKAKMEISTLTSTPKYVKEGENITYQLDISNTGILDIQNVTIEDNLPTEITNTKVTYNYTDSYGTEQNYSGMIYANNGLLKFVIPILKAGKTTKLKIEAKTNLLPSQDSKEISNKIVVNGMTSNTVKNTIEYNEALRKQLDDTADTQTQTYNHIISGTAWLDENKNGQREETESLLENIQVALLNSKTNQIVKDSATSQDKITTTNKNGQYSFSNVEPGSYLVIFVYDSANYSATMYHAKDVDNSTNSDAIEMNITLNGQRKLVGITDVINISSDNARDIDVGLYKVAKFDLSLEKYISKITLTTPTMGTRLYSNKDSKLNKVEILSTNIGKASMIIEYKLVVKNEGAVAGYARRLVDYIPEGVGFSTSSNKDWYLSENGNVYNTSLANVLIKPGETKSVTLVLTKKITANDMGKILNNNAEIDQSYNEEGLEDIDSIVSNKSQEEDDISGADIMISTVTGTIIKYTSLALGVILIIVIGIYEIKKRVLNKVERR